MLAEEPTSGIDTRICRTTCHSAALSQHRSASSEPVLDVVCRSARIRGRRALCVCAVAGATSALQVGKRHSVMTGGILARFVIRQEAAKLCSTNNGGAGPAKSLQASLAFAASSTHRIVSISTPPVAFLYDTSF